MGGFEVGMQWDAQLIGLDYVEEGEDGDTAQNEDQDELARLIGREKGIGEGNVKIFGWESMQDRVAKWVYCGDDRNTRKVWVGGRLVHKR